MYAWPLVCLALFELPPLASANPTIPPTTPAASSATRLLRDTIQSPVGQPPRAGNARDTGNAGDGRRRLDRPAAEGAPAGSAGEDRRRRSHGERRPDQQAAARQETFPGTGRETCSGAPRSARRSRMRDPTQALGADGAAGEARAGAG